MRPNLASVGLLLLTAALSGCVSFGGGYSSAPPPDPYWWSGAWAGAWAAAFLALLAILVLVAIALVALTLVAVVARGPAAQVAGAFLVVVGALFVLQALAAFSMLGMLLGLAMLAVGAAALVPPRQPAQRTAVLSEGKP